MVIGDLGCGYSFFCGHLASKGPPNCIYVGNGPRNFDLVKPRFADVLEESDNLNQVLFGLPEGGIFILSELSAGC